MNSISTILGSIHGIMIRIHNRVHRGYHQYYMEWNTKWDWEHVDILGSKGVASPKKLQSTEWGITAAEDINDSYNLSGIVGESGGSASDFGNNSSAKSSISASTESSFKGGIRASNFSFEGYGGFSDSYSKKKELTNGSSPSLEASVCSSEQSIGLRLGRRTYFENGFTRSNTKTPSSANIPVSSVSTMKKAKLSCQSTFISRCQVEGCNLDLSSAKEYHRKHKVCESHSKALKVVVAGQERRFCQQCSRFHGLSEFDGKKRSCRRRLNDHNARRRKPQHETIQFNSRNMSSSFYGGQQQMNFVFNNVPVAQTKPPASSIWVGCNSEHLVQTMKAEKHGGDNQLSHSLGIQFPYAVGMPTTLAFNRNIMPSRGTTAGVFHQGSNAEALDLRHALSLLSNSSWGSCEPDYVDHRVDHPVSTDSPNMPQHATPSASHSNGLQIPSPDYWQSIDSNTHFQASLIPRASFGIGYVNPMDEMLKPL